MLRRFFRIGFGGCGCALEETFRDHANELAYDLLNNYYLNELLDWRGVLRREVVLEMGTVDTLNSLLSKIKRKERPLIDVLKLMEKTLDDWRAKLDKTEGTWESYEWDRVTKIKQCIENMGEEVVGIQKRCAVLLESLPVDSYSAEGKIDEKKRTYIYNQNIFKTRGLIVDKYGKDILDSDGFNHHPELQMLPFSIKEVRGEVYDNITEEIIRIRKLLKEATRGYFFFVGLGGGTGTGVISPLAEKFTKGTRGHFALAVLGGRRDVRLLGSQQPWFRRCFNTLLGLNDLVKTAELDGLILLDNDKIIKILQDLKESNSKGIKIDVDAIDGYIIKAIYPAFGKTACESKGNNLDWSQLKGLIELEGRDKPPIFVPCYASTDDYGEEDILDLIDDALGKGMLADCNYQSKRWDKVFVYTRYIEDEDAVRQKLVEKFEIETEDIAIIKEYLFSWDDVPGDDNEKLLRFLKDNCGIDWAENTVKIDKPDDGKTIIIKKDGNLAEKIDIQINETKKEATLNFNGVKGKSPALNVKTEGGKQYLYLKGCPITREKVEKNLQAKVVVFESQEIGAYWKECFDSKKNEVLMLLVNPDIRNALFDRLKVAKKFVGLLSRFNYLVDKCDRELPKRPKEIAGMIIEEGKRGKITDRQYLFSWNEILKDRSKNLTDFPELLEFLKHDFDIGDKWTENAEIQKQDEETVHIFTSANVEKKIITEITIKEGGRKASLKIYDGGGIYKLNDELSVEKEGDELKIYVNLIELRLAKILEYESEILEYEIDDSEARSKSEKREKMREKILEEAKEFFFCKEIKGKWEDDVYNHLKKILKDLWDKDLVDKALTELDKGNWPIFDSRIFDFYPASISSDEVIVSSILARDMDFVNSFRETIGETPFESYFNNFQEKLLKNETIFVEGAPDYILSSVGESDEVLSPALKKKINRIPDEILIGKDSGNINPLTLLQTIIKYKKKKKVVNDKISLPKMWVLSTLYAKWEKLFSWNSNSGVDEGELRKFLKDNCDIDCANNNVNIDKSDDKKAISISKDGVSPSERKEIDIIRHESDGEEKGLLKICRLLFDMPAGQINLAQEEIPSELVDKFREENHELLVEHIWKKEEKRDNEWTIRDKKDEEVLFYIRKEDEKTEEDTIEKKLNIYTERIHELRVRKIPAERGYTLDIFKKRGEQFY